MIALAVLIPAVGLLPAFSAVNKRPAAKTATAALVAPTDQAIATRWLKTLTPRERVAQLIVIPFSGSPMNTRTRDYRRFVHLTTQEHVGGLVLINVPNGRPSGKPDPLEVASFVNRMQKLAKSPLIVAGDFERGASMRVDATTAFPHAMAFAATRDPMLARMEGEIAAREARALGVQWLFFPDADVNNNPDNPIINIRSFGEDPAEVSKMVAAFIEGAHSAGGPRVLVTAKHFPGHGDTTVDTHQNLAAIGGDRTRLERIEWAPFRAAIQSGVDAVMSAHLAVPAIDAPDLPATLSAKILTGVLRNEMGFKGIVVTDALEMKGIGQGFRPGDAAVRAIEAGADVLLMPPDPEGAIDAVTAAIKSGRLTQKRIDESAMRLLVAKAHLGLAANRLVEIDEVHARVNSPESNAVAQSVSDRAVTLIRNGDAGKATIPLKSPQSTAFFLLAESRTGVEGEAMELELRKRANGAMVIRFDSATPDAELHAALDRASQAGEYVVAAFASLALYRGAALAGGYPQFLQDLIATKKPVTLIALGNPYLLRSFPEVAAYLTTYSSVPPAEISAVKALFGEIAIGGKLPVTIPGFAKYGDGIVLPAVQGR